MKLIGIPDARLLRLPHLALFLAPWGRPVAPRAAGPGELAAIAGWGQGDRAEPALAAAARRGLPYLTLGAGFLRGPDPAAPWSLTVDDLGAHWDPSRPSRLEALIAEAAPPSDRFAALRARLDEGRAAPDLVVVLDQRREDEAVPRGGSAGFEAMLDAALAENPGARVVLRAAPGGRGLLAAAARRRGVPVLPGEEGAGDPLRRAARVYTVSAAEGLAALVAGVPVACFGLPCYAGWGLTQDQASCPRRVARPGLETLLAAVLERYPRYLDPVHGRIADALTVAQRIAAAGEGAAQPQERTLVLEVSRWKRPFVRPFVSGSRRRVSFAAASPGAVRRAAASGARLLVWAAREPAWLAAAAGEAGVPLARIEDGFLRSIGLGSDFIPALSLVIDDLGIYFDPRCESRLERILDTVEPSPALLDEARRLRARLVEARISKYNLASAPRRTLDLPAGRRVLLVPGQVEDDASIRLGAPGVRSNLGLLEAVRAAAPDAVILYKPHPDVESGNRIGAVPRAAALELADAVLVDWDAPAALELADEVHTMTSLLGFEALLRGKPVVTYGLPFYAGLGLTTDRLAWPRPRRPVGLDRLVAVAFLLYPRYRDPASKLPVTAFDVLEILERARTAPQAAAPRAGRLRRWLELTLWRG